MDSIQACTRICLGLYSPHSPWRRLWIIDSFASQGVGLQFEFDVRIEQKTIHSDVCKLYDVCVCVCVYAYLCDVGLCTVAGPILSPC